jgi:hypothetical protein
LSGHAHNYEYIKSNGVSYIVQGLGGSEIRCAIQPYVVPNTYKTYCDTNGYTLCEATSTSLVFKTYNVNDEIVDTRIFTTDENTLNLLNDFTASQSILNSRFVTTSSLNNFTSSYYTDSASFDLRITQATNEQDLSYLATTGSNKFIGQQVVSGSILISGSLIPSTGIGTFTSSFSLGSPTNAWKDLYLSHGSIIFVDAITQATSSFSIATDVGVNTVKYTAAITASQYLGDGGTLLNLPSNTNWNKDKEYILRNTEQLTFSGDYILENAALLIEGGDEEVEYSTNKSFKREGTIFIGGNLLLKDSTIQNNGKISVGGEVILIGNSTIVGNGIII